jgi:uncharacterized RDD family membrane protein YckC
MSCTICGEICRCSSVESHSASLHDGRATEVAGVPPLAVMPENDTALQQSEDGDDSAWRKELSARLNRYHSRRKPRPPRYPSLQLKFEQASTFVTRDGKNDFYHVAGSNQALALDEIQFDSSLGSEPETSGSVPNSTPVDMILQDEETVDVPPAIPFHVPSAKIIEFPRSWSPAPPPPDQLAEPVITTPRILEAPEMVPPPPALGGITIEPAQAPPVEKRPGIDIPLQSAALGRRISAAAIDCVIIAAACALFAFIFWKLTGIQPPRIQMAAVLAGLSALFWSAYQYLLIICAGSTPGLWLTRLELCRFDGSPAKRRLRQWRVLASFLSAASLGMGYLWVFLDEDALCWHDRITHTYLASLVSRKP